MDADPSLGSRRLEQFNKVYLVFSSGFLEIQIDCIIDSVFLRAFLRDEFNPKTPDIPGVKYYSVAGDIQPAIYNPLYFPFKNVERVEGPNDGLVSVESAKWGEFLGTRTLPPLFGFPVFSLLLCI